MNDDNTNDTGSREEMGAEAGRTPQHGESPAQAPLTAEALEELRKKAGERDTFLDELLRTKAELDNFQKRTRRERPAWEDQAVRRFIRDLLPVLDNFERAIETLESVDSKGGSPAKVADGIRLIYQMMRRVLRDHDVEEIQALGQKFDPELHEAIAQDKVSGRDTGEIIEVLERGYRHHDVVIRPSKVKVAFNAQEAETRKTTE